jgi:N-acetylglucosamine kinase-like BadF-type ATPase
VAISRSQLPTTTDRKRKKVSKVMREYKKGKLNIGKSKKKVKNRKQAIAIALNEAGIKQKRRRK